jgi:Zn-dependent protease with chaperone function
MKKINYYRTEKEQLYNFILMIFGVISWICLIYFPFTLDSEQLVGFLPILFYVFAFFLFLTLVAFVFRARAFGNMIHINESQFPELHVIVLEGSKELGIDPPDAFVMNSDGLFNAFAYRAFRYNYIMLTSAILDATTDEQIRFVIGHELGHIAAGHVDFFPAMLRAPARVIPFLHSAYSRQREYTCDAIGFHVSRNREDSCTAIQMLGCGCQKLNPKLNLKAFMSQEDKVPIVSGFLAEIIRSHPRLTRRVTALHKIQRFEERL